MGSKTKNIVWILFLLVLALSLLFADGASRRRRRSSRGKSNNGASSGGGLIALIVVGSIVFLIGVAILIRFIWAKKQGVPFWPKKNKTKPDGESKDSSTPVATMPYTANHDDPPPPYSDPVYPPIKY